MRIMSLLFIISLGLIASSAWAQNRIPSNPNVFFQTSSPKRCANIGDWYTTDGAGGADDCATAPSADVNGDGFDNDFEAFDELRYHFHRFDITPAMFAVAGGNIVLQVRDANISTVSPIDEENGAAGPPATPDPSRFILCNAACAPVALAVTGGAFTHGLSGASPQGYYFAGGAGANTVQDATFTFNTAGSYYLYIETGDRVINNKNAFAGGPPTTTTPINLNNDDNSYFFEWFEADGTTALPFAITATNFQNSFQHNAGAVTDVTDIFFFVSDPLVVGSLNLRNFDFDCNATFTYLDPTGATRGSPTVSGNGFWNGVNPSPPSGCNNGAGNLNTGADVIPLNASDGGWWQFRITAWSNNNQGSIEANDASGNRIPFVYQTTAELNLTKAVSDPTPQFGTNIDYTVTLTNNSTTNLLTSIEVTDQLPAGVSYVSHSISPSSIGGQAITYDDATGILSIPVLEDTTGQNSVTLTITARVQAEGVTVNTATVTDADQPFNDIPPNQLTDSATITVPTAADFGDAPLSYGDAEHDIVPPSLFLGAVSPDAETGSQYDANAQGDDSNGVNDEDGVSQGAAIIAGENNISVDVTASAPGRLDAWVDFNRNGNFSDPGEQIFTDVGVVAGVNSLSYNVPTDAVAGLSFTRYRLSTAGGLGPTGLAADGEVEDYPITINPNLAVIGDTIFYDRDNDGVEDAGEEGFANVDVELYAGTCPPSGGAIATTTTNASGNYSFSAPDVPDPFGTYCVQVDTSDPDLPTGGSSTTGGDFQQVTVNNNTVNTIDFGYFYPQVCLPGNLIDFELDALSNPIVEGQQFDAGVPASQVYSTIGVTISATSKNPAMAADTDLAMIYDSDCPGGCSGGDVDLGSPHTTFFGPGVGVAGASGQPNQNDVAQKNILIVSTDGDAADPDDEAAGGTFIFDFNPPRPVLEIRQLDGEDVAEVRTFLGTTQTSTIPVLAPGDNGLVTTPVNETAVTRLEVELNGSGSVTAIVSCGTPSPSNTISDFVFDDLDNDGIQDAGEPGIPGVALELYRDVDGGTGDLDTNGNGTIEATEAQLVLTATTAVGGIYSFVGLPDDPAYVVRIADSNFTAGNALEGYSYAGQDIGGDDTIDSDFDASNGQSQVITIAGSVTNDTIDAGFTRPDFGDAPVSYEAGTPASHTPSAVFMGTSLDSEIAAQNSLDAQLDDTTGAPDDEDGVTLGGSDLQGQSVGTGNTVTIDIATNGVGFLNAWADWNADGDFGDPGEQIATNAQEGGAGDTNGAPGIQLSVTVPAGATPGNTFVRFRYDSAGGLGPNGAAAAVAGSGNGGEVEDYQITVIQAPDLAVTKTVDDDRPDLYSTPPTTSITYTVRVDNIGGQDALAVTLDEESPGPEGLALSLPAGSGYTLQPSDVQITSVVPSAGSCSVPDNSLATFKSFNCTLNTITSGNFVTIDVTVTLDDNFPTVDLYGLILDNTATAPAVAGETNTTNNSDNAVAVVSGLKVTKLVCNQTAAGGTCTKPGDFATSAVSNPGDILEYWVQFENFGEDINNVVITDDIELCSTGTNCQSFLLGNQPGGYGVGQDIEIQCPAGGPPVYAIKPGLLTDPVSVDLATSPCADGRMDFVGDTGIIDTGDFGYIAFKVQIQ